MKTTRLTHPAWIVRFSPSKVLISHRSLFLRRGSDFRGILQVYACNLRNLVTKIKEIERYVVKANLSGEILRYHAISAALTTVKYDLLTLYVTLRSGSLTAMKTSFLYPILSDTQRWLTYAYYQIKMILSSFPGSNASRQLRPRLTNTPTKACIPSFYTMSKRAKKSVEQSEINSNKSQTEPLSTSENI